MYYFSSIEFNIELNIYKQFIYNKYIYEIKNISISTKL